MHKGLKLILSGLVMCGTVCSAPLVAHAAAHAREPVIILGECPDKGDNAARWISNHGHHAIAMRTDGSNWAGFEIFANSAAIAHGQLPNSPGLIPAGTYSFRVLSASPSNLDFYIDAFSAANCFVFGGGGFFPDNNGIVSFTIPENVEVVNIYLDAKGPSSAIVDSVRFNNRVLAGTTLVDRSNAHAFNFCALGQATNCP